MGLYLVHLSLHGLIRAEDPELGRDRDTGGQVDYVLNLARALCAHEHVDRVDLLTRRIHDPEAGPDYAREIEEIPGTRGVGRLVRVDCGPREYLPKEDLWPHLYEFTDNAVAAFHASGRTPDLIHAHYADAGWVGARMAALIDRPLIFTGHSLGYSKQKELRKAEVSQAEMEDRYAISQRIEAEETALDTAAAVIASTADEQRRQYSQYANYRADRIAVIPPGVDIDRFRAPEPDEPPDWSTPLAQDIRRFLAEPDKPMVLAIARADRRKNLDMLADAFGRFPGLKDAANLVIVAGNRDDIAQMPEDSRAALTALWFALDRHDLYGKFALPRRNTRAQVMDLYRLAAATGGVFVNPALVEPFGLTLIEAAASGLPVVATQVGGPVDIVRTCNNGYLIDPTSASQIGSAIFELLNNQDDRAEKAAAGVAHCHAEYAWKTHVRRYLDVVQSAVDNHQHTVISSASFARNRGEFQRLLVCDMDDTLLGDAEAAEELAALLEDQPDLGFVIATGRVHSTARDGLADWPGPQPTALIAAVGSEIRVAPDYQPSKTWRKHIGYRWAGGEIRDALEDFPDLELQSAATQGAYKLSYEFVTDNPPSYKAVREFLRERDLHANVLLTRKKYLDILPIRANKGLALRFLALRWNIPLDQVIVAGSSGNDYDMLCGGARAIVVANHGPELDSLRGTPGVYFAQASHAAGVAEGLRHYL